MSDPGAVLLRVVEGDGTRLAELVERDHSTLQMAAADLRLVVTPEAVQEVLRTLQAEVITAEQAQRWASFVRRGVIAGGRVTHIEYELPYEDVIVEAVARLDELGDLVEGELGAGELAAMLRSLERRR